MHLFTAIARCLLPFAAIGLGLGNAICAEPATAFPSKSIRLVVPYPPGSGTDILARILAKEIGGDFNQAVIVDNRPGASTVIGTDIVAKAAPDGYTLVMATNSHSMNPALFAKLPFDPIADFTPVGWVAILPFVLVANPTLPVTNVKELIALAKSKPGKLTYASTGNGTPPHVGGASLCLAADINVVHVPYKGSADAITAIMTGTVDFMFANSVSVLPQIRAGNLRALAVATPTRFSLLPDLPTVAESGFPKFDVSLWAGLLAPAGTPKDIVTKLNTELVRVLARPDVKESFAKQGAEIRSSTPEAFGQFVADEVTRLGDIARAIKLHLD